MVSLLKLQLQNCNYLFEGCFVSRDPHCHLALPESVQPPGDGRLEQERPLLAEGTLELHILGRPFSIRSTLRLFRFRFRFHFRFRFCSVPIVRFLSVLRFFSVLCSYSSRNIRNRAHLRPSTGSVQA